MPDDEKVLSNYRLQRAEEDLKSSKILFQNNLYKQAVNRSYYAIFHATRAVLALDKFDSRKHSGIIAYFNQHYIATDKIETEYSKILMSAQKIRNSSDYDDFYIVSKEEA
ncbi:MAG TPA: HEPN domain-containing protein [Thermoanaerobacterales bacterium]|nr:HEPN domain-containing protein [Thermoanaerobacterales bacterium]